jgi:hypothetical protein
MLVTSTYLTSAPPLMHRRKTSWSGWYSNGLSLLLVQRGLFVELAGRAAAAAAWWLQWRDGAWAIDDFEKVPGKSHKDLVIITSGDDSLKIL